MSSPAAAAAAAVMAYSIPKCDKYTCQIVDIPGEIAFQYQFRSCTGQEFTFATMEISRNRKG